MGSPVILLPDTSPKVGLGHFYRCLRLGIALREAGHRPVMVGVRFSVTQRDLLTKHRVSSKQLSSVSARRVTSFLSEYGDKPSWIVTDHYHLAEEWERKIRPHVGRIAVFDDADGRRHDCDLVINGAFSPSSGRSYYRGKVPRHATLLLGPRYGLPDPLLKEVRRKKRVDTPVRSLCFFLGGAVSLPVYQRYLRSLLKELPEGVKRVVSIPPSGAKVSSTIAADPRLSIITDYSNLKAALRDADLFIGSGGAISYDRISVGIPAVVVSMAENQRELSTYLARLGTQVYLGDYRSVSPQALVHHVTRLIARGRDLKAMRSRCRGVVDGRGAERIVTEIARARRLV